MKKDLKKLLLFLSAVVMLMVMMCFGASAFELNPTGQCGDNVYWNYNEVTGELVLSGEGDTWDEDSYHNGSYFHPKFDWGEVKTIVVNEGITSIGKLLFNRCNDVTSVTLPESLLKIEWEAFFDCRNLTEIKIPAKVSYIDSTAFDYCDSLKGFDVSEENQYYSNDSYGVLFNKNKTVLVRFPGVGESSYEVPEGVELIEKNAFRAHSDIESISIPASVTEIKDYAFDDCDKITRVNIEDLSSWVKIKYSDIFGADGANPLCYGADLYLNGEIVEELVIPGNITYIAEYSFYGCKSIKSVVFCDGITSIGKRAFHNCSALEKVTMSNSIISIEEKAFALCGKLKSVDFSDKLVKIGSYAFSDCGSLSGVVFPESLTTIEGFAFEACDSILNIDLPSATVIENTSFGACDSLVAVNVSEDNTRYSNDSEGVLFNKDKTVLLYYPAGLVKETYTIPEYVTNIGEYAFYSCSAIKNVIIPGNVKDIGDYAFYSSPVQNVKIMEGVETIGAYAFMSWNERNSISIPLSVTSIGFDAFEKGIFKDLYYAGAREQYLAIDGVDYGYERIHYLTDGTDHYTKNVTAPTCTEKGYTTYTCPCGYTYTDDEVPSLGHDYTSSVTTQPTCTEKGYTTYICPCGYTYTDDEVPSLGHDYTSSVTTAPTCTEDGVKTFVCVCGKSYTERLYATGHNYNDEEICENCGDKIEKSFFEKIAEFFEKIIEWFKNLFSF